MLNRKYKYKICLNKINEVNSKKITEKKSFFDFFYVNELENFPEESIPTIRGKILYKKKYGNNSPKSVTHINTLDSQCESNEYLGFSVLNSTKMPTMQSIIRSQNNKMKYPEIETKYITF